MPNTPPRILYRNARLLDPATGLDRRGDLLTAGAEIVDFGPGLPVADAAIIDLDGLCLAPGLVDMRVSIGTDQQAETVGSVSRAAAAGGVTALACLPDTDPPLDSPDALALLDRRARAAGLVRIYPYAALTRGMAGRDLAEIGLLAEAGAVGFTDGTRAVADAGVMDRALRYAAGFGRPVVQHPEEPALAAGGVLTEGEIATRLGLPGIPPEAEVIVIERDLRLVERAGSRHHAARYHAAHVSTALAVDAIRQAKRRGLRVTCDTAPPYFALTETDVTGATPIGAGIGAARTAAKFSPPLRGEMDRRAIVEGLADGTIDAIASDHSPHPAAAKDLPFARAAAGAAGLETLLPLTLELVHNGRLGLLDALALLTVRPADIVGLPLGRLRRGGAADFVIFDPDRLWRIDAGSFRSGSRISPFDRRPVTGRVVRTVACGRTVFTLEG